MADPSAQAAHDLRVLFGRLRRRLKEVASVGDLTASQTSVLSRLVKDGPATASDLAAAERVRPQSVAATLAALHERGLIERRPDPADGRRQLISLSEAGDEMLAGGRQAREEWLTRAFQERFTAAERATVAEALALLERLTDA
jgi:DNA-binding MarR family transcriptional regulator